MTPDEEAALAELVWRMTSPHTQEDIAAHLGVSQEYVCQVEKRAMAKLQAMTHPDWKPEAGPSGYRNITLVLK